MQAFSPEADVSIESAVSTGNGEESHFGGVRCIATEARCVERMGGSEQKRTAQSEDELPEQRAATKARPAPADEEGALVESAKLSFGRVELGTGSYCQPECADIQLGN